MAQAAAGGVREAKLPVAENARTNLSLDASFAKIIFAHIQDAQRLKVPTIMRAQSICPQAQNLGAAAALGLQVSR